MSAGPADCPICFKRYNSTENEPKMMALCSHTICSSCLQGILQRNRQCPLDRVEFSKSCTNVGHFLRNTPLLDLIENQKFNLCPIHGEQQTFMCITDLKKICGRCYHAEHRGNHKVEHIEDIKISATKKTEQLKKLRTTILENQKEVGNQG